MTAPAADKPTASWSDEIMAILREHYGHVEHGAAHKLLNMIAKEQLNAVNNFADNLKRRVDKL